MCNYCEGKARLLKNTVNAGIMLFNPDYEDIEVKQLVIINSGYLRLVDADDYGCLDHGEKLN